VLENKIYEEGEKEVGMSRKLIVLFVILVIFTFISFSQQQGEISYQDTSFMPEGKKGERIQSLIDTFNSNDPERITRFLNLECTERFRNFAPLEEHIQVFQQTLRSWGKIAFHGIRTYVPERRFETIVILKDQNFDTWRAVSLSFDEKNDFLIAGIGFNDTRTPTNVQEPALTEQQVTDEISALLGRLAQQDLFSGTVLLAKDGEVLFTFACGEASKRFHVPNNINTKFNLGSMNKMFTATAIAQLVEKGVLAYDDPLSEYLDESWLPEEITSKITLHHLLSNTSGLGSYFNQTYMNSSKELFRALEDYKPLIKDEKLAFEPGKRYQYSNTGMFLLGVVIEKATGENYFDYIRRNIYEPAGMIHSDCYEMDYPVENLAIGYHPDPRSPYGWKNNLYMHVIKGGPAGGGFSTVKDLHKFARALCSEKLVTKESLELMWTDQAGANYGYGFSVTTGPAGKVVGHSGGFPGINSDLSIFVDKGYIAAVLSNYSSAASPVAQKISDLLSRLKIP
jgi:CubicO group peptidase (beta-lactamase class C family)